MPGNLFGGGPSGTTTTTSVNPTQQAQLPFLQGGWQAAANQAQNNPTQYYPGQTLYQDQNQFLGNKALIDTGYGNNSGVAGAGNNAFLNAADGGMGVKNSPVFGSLNSLAGGGSPTLAAANTEGNLETGVGNDAFGAANHYASGIESAAYSAPGAVYPNVGTLEGNAGLALNTPGLGALSRNQNLSLANPATGMLAGNSALALGGNPATGMLAGNSALALGGNPAMGALGFAANGGYLGSNPNLAGEFNAAADPVVRNYMTATAPQTDSNYEAAGRYGSGALANAQGQNESNLGNTLQNLSSNIYGQDYANERGLQTQAQGLLGSNFLGGIGASTQAANAAGSNFLGGVGASTEAANAAGSNFLGGIGASTNAAGTLGSNYLSGVGTSNSAENAAGNLALNAQNSEISGLGTAAGAQNSDLGTAASAFGSGGNLQLGIAGQENTAGSTLQSGYENANNDILKSLALEPSVQAGNTTPAQDLISGANGLAGLNEAQITDAQNRFYGNQQAPWQNINQYLNAIGQPTSGSGSVTQPYFTPSLASQGLGLGLGANALFGSNGAFPGALGGIGSAIGGLFGGGAGASGLGSAIGFGGATGGLDIGTLLGLGGMGLIGI